jgi:hypothetical protein
MLNIVTEINMKKNSVNISLFCILIIASILVVPIYGISAEKDGTVKEVQLCCFNNEVTNDDDSQLLILNNIPKHYLDI